MVTSVGSAEARRDDPAAAGTDDRYPAANINSHLSIGGEHVQFVFVIGHLSFVIRRPRSFGINPVSGRAWGPS